MAAVGRLTRGAFQTWDGAEVNVHGRKLAIRHVLKGRPPHHLEQSSIVRANQTGGSIRTGRTVGVSVIQVYSGPHDQLEIRKRVTFGPPCLVGCQVAGNNVQ